MLNFKSVLHNFEPKSIPLSLVLESVENEYLLDAQERREKGVWAPENLYSGSAGECAHALYKYLIREGKMDPETTDVYDIILMDWAYDLREFTTTDFEEKWMVGSEADTRNSAESSLEEFIKEHGFSGFREGFANQYIDNDAFNSFVRMFFENDAYDDPESYLDETDRLPSEKQEQFLTFYRLKLDKLRSKLKSEGESKEVLDEIGDVLEKIEDIHQNPLGEYDDSKLDDYIEARVENYRDEPEDWFKDYYGGGDEEYSRWLEENDFIDKEELIEAVIDEDGFGNILNHYDGSVDEEIFNDEIYYIFYDGEY